MSSEVDPDRAKRLNKLWGSTSLQSLRSAQQAPF